ncbi:hypothetical protein OCL06_02210 [Alteromonas sp. ASW11-19]|uniref:Phosphatidate cytidylyltransferase n=1 Tax=Alteromonas salexigens TaxID=2982530 RepID=A0ABT2VLU5_9ALTE|nr:hypothetical protein [Alteromonas salexigens]MCU7553408.1 hypothetical protein [Alteromonas salexigens]
MVSRIAVIVLCLLAAIGCYVVGLRAGIVVFVLLGVVFELIFWLRLASRDRLEGKPAHKERS